MRCVHLYIHRRTGTLGLGGAGESRTFEFAFEFEFELDFELDFELKIELDMS